MSISKSTTDIATLKINYLTQEMYDAALANNQINENELYVTPNEPEFTVKNNYEVLCEENISLYWITGQVNGESVQHENFLYGETSYLNYINAEVIKVTISGTEYICKRQVNSVNSFAYGNSTYIDQDYYDTIDWSVYPFRLVSTQYNSSNETIIYTTTDFSQVGTLPIKIEALTSSSITTSSDFSAAVNHVIDSMKVEGGSY